GVHLVQAQLAGVEVARLAGVVALVARRVEPGLVARDEVGAPRARGAVGAVRAPLRVVLVAGAVPVADVDDMQSWDAVRARSCADVDRLLEEHAQRSRTQPLVAGRARLVGGRLSRAASHPDAGRARP